MTRIFIRNLRTQRGFMFVDTLLGLAIIGVFASTLLSSISTGFIGLMVSQNEAMAESLVRSQLESVKSQNYMTEGGYSLISAPSGYSITTGVESISGVNPSAMQRVVVTVYRGSKVIQVMRDFKVNR